MKVLVVCNDFNNFGGIISHTEQLIAGFKDLGHETGFVYLRSTKSGGKFSDDYDKEGYDIGMQTCAILNDAWLVRAEVAATA